MMTLTLHAAGSTQSKDAQQPRVTNMASTYVPPESSVYPAFERLAAEHYLPRNVHCLSGYTHNRQLIGSWFGREGNGGQEWSTWNFSRRTSVELSGRSMTLNREFLRGSLRDLNVTANIAEWWNFLLLSTGPQQNAAFTLQLPDQPLGRRRK
jgi:hypothetical protein